MKYSEQLCVCVCVCVMGLSVCFGVYDLMCLSERQLTFRQRETNEILLHIDCFHVVKAVIFDVKFAVTARLDQVSEGG